MKVYSTHIATKIDKKYEHICYTYVNRVQKIYCSHAKPDTNFC